MGDLSHTPIHQTVELTKTWLSELGERLPQPTDEQHGFHALRVVLHALRDRLMPDEAANLSAQLPMLLRGLFYEGYRPSDTPTAHRSREAFLEDVRQRWNLDPMDPEVLVRAVMDVLRSHVTQGEIEDVEQMMPGEIRAIWQ